MQVELLEKLSTSDAAIILEHLPEKIKTALIDRATEIEYQLRPLLKWRSRSVSERESLVFWIQKLWVLQTVNQGEDNKNYDV